MGIRLITDEPTVEPVTLAEIKQDLNISHTDDDVKLGRFIASAREWVERRIQQKIASQTWEFIIDAFPAAEIKMPFTPVQGIVSILYDSSGGLEAEVDPINYYLDNVSKDHWVFPIVDWPATLDAVNSVRITLVGGYATPEEAPTPLRQAIRLKVQEFYDREDNGQAIHDLLTNYYQFAI
jgi:uncharacterized phiE125 gp8 family phage protein